jgi:hypothetical protein
MSESYGNPHKLPVTQCAANTPTWTTDPTITAGTTKIRKPHIDELRTKVNAELTRRGLTNYTFTDSTIVAGTTKVRKIHLDDLRTAISINIKKGDCSTDTYYCPQDTSGSMAFTDPTVTAGTTKVRKTHIDELRTKLAALMVTCICEAEQCDYCADCGYKYSTCSHNGVACNNHQSGESCGYNYPTGPCGSRNTGGAHPFREFTTGGTGTVWDGYVPWAMGSGIPGAAINWTSSPWTCKCNPYSYDGICTHCSR